MLYFQLSWRDARAQPAVLDATAAAASDPGYNSGNGCQFPCSSLYQWTPGAPWWVAKAVYPLYIAGRTSVHAHVGKKDLGGGVSLIELLLLRLKAVTQCGGAP